ncbi:hypothetical protein YASMINEVIRUS_460 [Yasminevirus sp. GU-2018]|uniref:Uncharacterized protein n=1 Tax=Yasminevirus sp. GU-2018 TaxID=2420051 RepID=A0A5K0U830_9VIRU|nr:hypothetical protein YASMINEVIRUS_460 [Yasminevirus sp. GU-2018]
MLKIEGTIDPKENPRWPPRLNNYITVQKSQPDGPIYVGKVLKILQNNVGAIIHLVKGFEYPNEEVKPYIKATADSKRFMLVIETDGWRTTTETNVRALFRQSSTYEIDELNNPVRKEELVYDDTQSGRVSIGNKYYASATEDPDIAVPLQKLVDSQDIDDFAFLVRKDVEYANKALITQQLPINKTTSTFVIEDNVSPKVKMYRQDIIDVLEGKTVKSEDLSEQADNPSATLTDADKLRRSVTKPYDILVADQMMITKFVPEHEALAKEADKIKNFLSEVLRLSTARAEQNTEALYGAVRFVYYNGYLHIFRTDIPLREEITHDLLKDHDDPKLKILGEREYGQPIRHNVLKYILFQNEVQKSINVDQQLLSEAELVLSQEYIIALTPEPRYQMWCVVRLIKLWFGDIELQNNVRKIKILINQYRARTDKRYNVHNGIRFSIGVYPRYGKESASIVLKRLMYYFSLYFQAIGWKNNPPSYFKVVNSLISYTNCDQSLKLYYRRVASENNQTNNVFSKNYTLINSAGHNTDILEQYVPV